jgi:sporulation protein YunB
MHNKIYSRRRIRIPQIKSYSKNTVKCIKIAVILCVAFIVVDVVMNAVSPVFDRLCEDEARSIATIITNEEASSVMAEHNYEDLFTIEKDTDGNITMIKSNVFPINEIISNTAVNIQKRINDEGRDNINIAAGTFTGIKLLAGRGPNINIKVSSIGNVETDLKSEFTAQGINQTLHRVYLQVECQISILTPFNNTEESIVNQVLIAENVIVGNIPDAYYNINVNEDE